MKVNRKQITLPSGGTCVVRRLAERDFIAAGQTLLFLNLNDPERLKKRISENQEAKAFEAAVDLHYIMLTRCVGPITSGEQRLTIVDKAFHECSANEVTVEDLDQADAVAIVEAVKELSGLKKEAVKAAATFPEGSADSGVAASAGEELSSPADATARSEPA